MIENIEIGEVYRCYHVLNNCESYITGRLHKITDSLLVFNLKYRTNEPKNLFSVRKNTVTKIEVLI